MTRHCHACGQAHELGAHHDPEAMEREATRAAVEGRTVAAAVWRARAACTRAGHVVVSYEAQTVLEGT